MSMSSNNKDMTQSSRRRTIELLIFFLTFWTLSYGQYLIFVEVPGERVMGAVQRIFYFHVGSAVACYVSSGVILISALYFLSTRERRFDDFLQAAGEVAFLFCTITLVAGMIWGHYAWNTWFRFEPRLVSFLILWLILLSLCLLRVFGDHDQVSYHSAVLGIIAALMVPIIYYSIKLLPQSAQLHPQVVGNRGLKHPLYYQTLYVIMLSLVLLQFVLIWIRSRILFIVRNVDGNNS